MKHPLLFALLATIIALALRLPHLERRPMHTDEAVHGVRFADLLERGAYEYDPHDYHGPMLYYATLPVAWLRGERTLWQLTETTLRLVPLLFGIGLILLLYLAGGALGRAEAAWAALFTAVSPFMVYFSRYYIMEMLLVFFTFALLLSVWRYWQSGKAGWAVAVGVCVGLMHATKETCVITWFCVAVALAGLWFVQSQRPAVRPAHLVAFVLAAVVVSVTLFSVFYTDWRGVPQSVLTYFHYIRRGQGSGHEHPWYAYLRWFVWHRTGKIVWTELAILLLAMLGGILAFRQQHGFGKLLGFYATVMAAVYFLIPYKTPWSILSWVHALILLAGIAAAWLAKRVPWLAWPLLLVVAAHLAFQSLRAISARFECDERAPYVYSHTSRDAVRLAERIQQIAAVSPERKRMVVKFMAKEYWPLPWYLREMPHVGYWNQPADPTGASVIITSPEFNLDFGEGWQTELFGLRPGVVLVVHIRRDLWDKFMESRR